MKTVKARKSDRLNEHFQGLIRGTIISYLIGTEILKFQPNLCLWQMFKRGTCQGILANFATKFFKPPQFCPGMAV